MGLFVFLVLQSHEDVLYLYLYLYLYCSRDFKNNKRIA